MKTTQMVINVDNREMKVKVQDEAINFNLFEAMKHPKDKGICFRMDAT